MLKKIPHVSELVTSAAFNTKIGKSRKKKFLMLYD